MERQQPMAVQWVALRLMEEKAWCLEHNKTTPPSQTMSGDFYTSTEPK